MLFYRMPRAISTFQRERQHPGEKEGPSRAISAPDCCVEEEFEVIQRNVPRNNEEVFSMVRIEVELLQRNFPRYVKDVGFSPVDQGLGRESHKERL